MKPQEALQQHLHQRVLVEVRGGKSFRGVLQGFDQHLNLVLSQAEEIEGSTSTSQPGLTLLRGDSVIYISP
jgi:small nuclear ribonucleoprotein